jgi:hypothetical protein
VFGWVRRAGGGGGGGRRDPESSVIFPLVPLLMAEEGKSTSPPFRGES